MLKPQVIVICKKRVNEMANYNLKVFSITGWMQIRRILYEHFLLINTISTCSGENKTLNKGEKC